MYLVDQFLEHREEPAKAVDRPRFVIPKVVAVVGIFLFAYAYIGYQVPQKVGLPPEKKVLDLAKISTQDDLVQIGQDIFYSKGQCALCHAIGTGAGRCPNLSGVGERLRREFIYETLTKPEAYVKLDFYTVKPVDYPAHMPIISERPIGLSEQELLTVIAFIQSIGGKVTVMPEELDLYSDVEEAEIIEQGSEVVSEELAMIRGGS